MTTKKIAWKTISEFVGPEQSPGFLLWQVSTKWRRLIETALAEIGLTHPQFVLLASLGWLSRDGSKITQVELARHCKLDITMTSQVLRSLEKRGMVERLSHEDARSKIPRLTKRGAELVEQAIPKVEQIDREFFKKLGPQTKEFIAILQDLID